MQKETMEQTEARDRKVNGMMLSAALFARIELLEHRLHKIADLRCKISRELGGLNLSEGLVFALGQIQELAGIPRG